MGTRGFIGIKADDKITGTYNHFDSYPSYLGVRMIEFIQRPDFAELAAKVATLQSVDEGETPTSGQLAVLKARGFWRNVSTGTDWYSALRNAQGDLAAYIDAGYIPSFDVDGVLESSNIFIEYGYVIDLDKRELRVYENGAEDKPMLLMATVPFDNIQAPGFDGQAYMNKVEQSGYMPGVD